ncbi:MAG: hypothetical protein RR681_02760, partial [Lachnospiraceae bacterium]
MDEIEFSELVKVAAEKMKNITVHQMLQGNIAFYIADWYNSQSAFGVLRTLHSHPDKVAKFMRKEERTM